ncbi:oligopeptide ABC transporter ATP-binding protein [Candidatus Bathyarchaeota archaeon RBG_13_60_20]|jgi:peptide/nickel transport system ATP-binding protein|nr:MAG: oligopeptide ABC transporter ATP-binding protein [Candidatus Bathyarchaeota archaeon RBG_13_60_20]
MSERLVRVEGLVKHFPVHMSLLDSLLRREVPMVKAVDGVSFTIKSGEIFGLVGESGCGKTTTGRAVIRLIEPTSGHVLFDGVDVDELPRGEVKAYRREMQIIFQDPFESLNPKMTIYELVAEPLEIHGIGAGDEERRALISEALNEVQLIPPEEFLFRYPHELSGGQRQRVAIARVLILKPRFVVADEPVSMLDVSIRTEVLNLMLDIREKLGLTILFITHDLAIARYMSDDIGVMYLGKLIECGGTHDVLDDPDHPYTQALMAAVPVPDAERRRGDLPIRGETPQPINVPPGCRFHPRCPYAFDRCKVEEPPLVEVEPGHAAACFLQDEFHAGRLKRGRLPEDQAET